jgi:ABC-type anion transport system duplicated permease subunit
VSLFAGIPANILNFIFLFVAFVGTGFSGKRGGELALMTLFAVGNFILMLYSWIRAMAMATEEEARSRQSEIAGA